MSDLLVRVMTDWLGKHPGGPLTFCLSAHQKLKQTFTTKVFRRALRGSKWVLLHGFHVFRHSFASNLAAAGVDQWVIDEFMGHQTETMRKRYRHLLPDQATVRPASARIQRQQIEQALRRLNRPAPGATLPPGR